MRVKINDVLLGWEHADDNLFGARLVLKRWSWLGVIGSVGAPPCRLTPYKWAQGPGGGVVTRADPHRGAQKCELECPCVNGKQSAPRLPPDKWAAMNYCPDGQNAFLFFVCFLSARERALLEPAGVSLFKRARVISGRVSTLFIFVTPFVASSQGHTLRPFNGNSLQSN
jgi:hypothetical protein